MRNNRYDFSAINIVIIVFALSLVLSCWLFWLWNGEELRTKKLRYFTREFIRDFYIVFASLLFLIILFYLLVDMLFCRLMNSQYRKSILLLNSTIVKFVFEMRAAFPKWIRCRLRTFFEMVLYSQSLKIFRFLLLGVMVSVGTIATILLVRRILFVLRKVEKDPKGERNIIESWIVMLTTLAAVILLTFVLDKVFVYSYFYLDKIFYQIIRNKVGAGLLCGFVATATMGYCPYILLARRLALDNFEDSFYFEHHQKRVAVIASFFVGQCFQFLFFYDLPMFETLYKRNWILLLFLIFLVFQVFWTHQTIVKNYRYLYPNDKRKRVLKRILFVQFEFVANFFIQLALTGCQLEKQNSKIRYISLFYMPDKIFVRMSFLGWFLGHIVLTVVYTKVFVFGRILYHAYLKYLFDSKSNGG